MRPIELIISAFGPYAKQVKIDFEKIKSGIFLITGDTGAGKTTIFDAISFALYGEPSGDTREVSQLRSKYADPKEKTFVELKFMYKNKEYTVNRSPQYERPRERGEGTTINKASATLTFGDGSEPIVKYKEVTEKIEEITGMKREQFSQIAMIAQNDFMKLLLAKTEQRTAIFRDIFGTEKYKKFEEQCALDLKEIQIKISDTKKDILKEADRFKESEETKYLEMCRKTGEVLYEEEIIDEIEKNKKELKNEIENDRKSLSETEKKLEKINTGILKMQEIMKVKSELKTVCEEINKLTKEQELIKEELKLTEEYEKQIKKMEADIILEEEKMDEYKEMSEIKEIIKKLKKEDADMEDKLKAAVKGLTDAEKSISEYTCEYENKKNADLEYVVAQKDSENIQKLLDEKKAQKKSIQEYEKNKEKLEESTKKYVIAKNEYVEMQKKYITLEQLFYDEQAGILAGRLKENMPCPVCGSVKHPNPARENKEAPTKEELESFKEKLGEHENEVRRISEETGKIKGMTQSLEKMLDNMEDKTNLQPVTKKIKQLQEKSDLYVKKIEECKKQKERKEELEELLSKIQKKHKFLTTEKTETEKNSMICKKELEENEKNLVKIQKNLRFDTEEEAVSYINGLKQAKQKLEKENDDIKNREKENENKRSELNIKKEMYEKRIGGNTDDIQYDEYLTQKNEMSAKKEYLQNCIENKKINMLNNEQVCSNLKGLFLKRKNQLSEYNVVKSIADTVKGKISEKDKIGFETFIQIYYFEKIIKRANKRLIKMTNHQYELVRREEAADKKAKSGLELDVIDHYNGTKRSVRTLSGGESFKASLALALGLSDEIQMSSGGIQPDTIFIDEGFGTLDEESLKSAMKILLELSEGNRLIGIISHVGELKQTIERQIIVKKEREGGSLIEIE